MVEETIRQINQFALLERSTFSQINLDFVLSTNSYYSSAETTGQSSDPQSIFGFSASAHCFPCVDQNQNSKVLQKQKVLNPATATTSHPKSTIVSLSFEFVPPFQFQLLRQVLDEILYNNGKNETMIYRMKGLIKVQDEKNYYFLQAVYNTFDLEESNYLVEKDPLNSKIIVIGLNLDEKLLEEKFRSCLVVS
jgi:G3E family GTPase